MEIIGIVLDAVSIFVSIVSLAVALKVLKEVRGMK